MPVSPKAAWTPYPKAEECSHHSKNATDDDHSRLGLRRRRAAVVFRGDAFRLAGCSVRSAPKALGHVGYRPDHASNAAGVQWQIKIYDTYVEYFEKPLLNIGYAVDYFIVQYPTPHDMEIRNFFGKRLRSWTILDSGDQGVSAVVGLLALQRHCEQYDFVMVSRHDVRLTRNLVADLGIQEGTTAARSPTMEKRMVVHKGQRQKKKNGGNNCPWCQGKTSKTMQMFGRDTISWCAADFTWVVGAGLLAIFTEVLRNNEPHWPTECFEPLKDSYAAVNGSFWLVEDFARIVREKPREPSTASSSSSSKKSKSKQSPKRQVDRKKKQYAATAQKKKKAAAAATTMAATAAQQQAAPHTSAWAEAWTDAQVAGA